MLEESKNNREAWIDWAKTLLIYFVVVGHAGCKGGLQELLYAFHMPAFFIISGYLYRPHDWKKTLKNYIVPIVFYSIINLFFKIGIDIIKGGVDWCHYATMSWKAYYSVAFGSEGYITLFPGVWFIVVLMFCRFLSGDVIVCLHILKYYKELALLFVIWIISEPLFFSSTTSCIQDLYLYRVLSCFPFVAIGMFMKEHKHILNRLNYCQLPPPYAQ